MKKEPKTGLGRALVETYEKYFSKKEKYEKELEEIASTVNFLVDNIKAHEPDEVIDVEEYRISDEKASEPKEDTYEKKEQPQAETVAPPQKRTRKATARRKTRGSRESKRPKTFANDARGLSQRQLRSKKRKILSEVESILLEAGSYIKLAQLYNMVVKTVKIPGKTPKRTLRRYLGKDDRFTITNGFVNLVKNKK